MSVQIQHNKMKDDKNKFQTKIYSGTKGQINDISIIAIILTIFFTTAISIGFVNAEFGTEFSSLNETVITQQARNDAESVSAISAFTILKNVLLLALFDVGNSLNLPFWLDALYTILAVIFILVISRNIWVGGGA